MTGDVRALPVHLCRVEPCGECGATPGTCCPHCDDWDG